MKKLIALGSRPAGRLFYCLVSLLVMVTLARAFDTAPAKTLISDVIYRADGTPATGTLVISWPAFVTADNKAVAAGNASFPLSSGGQVSLELVPNAGGNPAGTYYKVVLKLDDGTSAVEYWAVPATSPTTIAVVRATIAPVNVAVQSATRQYVDAQLATKANDNAVVHVSGDETITGAKEFVVAPAVPAPATALQAANKQYVDTATSHLGLGTAAYKDIPATGNASATEVVYGTDTRLTDARTPAMGSTTDKQVLFNDVGALSGDAGLTFDKASGTLFTGTIYTYDLVTNVAGNSIGIYGVPGVGAGFDFYPDSVKQSRVSGTIQWNNDDGVAGTTSPSITFLDTTVPTFLFGNNTWGGENDALGAIWAGKATFSGGINYASGGGTAQAQTVTLSPAATALTAGLVVNWKPAAANTGAAPTLAVNLLTAKAITKCGTAALVANDLTTTAIATARYDGTQFQLLNPQASTCAVIPGNEAGASNQFLTAYSNTTGAFSKARPTCANLSDSSTGCSTTVGTAAAKNIPATGNASATEVVYGTDTRLTDARTPAGHASSHGSGQADAISITKAQVSDFPTLGTAAAKDIPASGNASSSQVVYGTDTRLTDARTAAAVGVSFYGFTFFPPPTAQRTTGAVENSNNSIIVFPHHHPVSTTINSMTFYVAGAVAGSTCDVGFYKAATLVCHTGAVSTATTGQKTVTGLACTMPAGDYELAQTCSASTVNLGLIITPADYGPENDGAPTWGYTNGTVTGGVLPTSMGTVTAYGGLAAVEVLVKP